MTRRPAGFARILSDSWITADAWTSQRPAGGELAARLRINRNTGATRIAGLPTGIAEADADDLIRLLRQGKAVAKIVQELFQRERNHPAKLGFVQAPLPRTQHNFGFSNTLWNADAKLPVPASETRGAGGWFAPDADPHELGALFVFPLCEPDEGNPTLYWKIGQVGVVATRLPGEQGSAEWNDDAGCARLFEIVRQNDIIPRLVATAMNDPEMLAKAKDHQEWRRDMITARTRFANRARQIRPHLTEDATTHAYQQMTAEWKETLADTGAVFTSTVVSLNEWQLGDVKPVNAGCVAGVRRGIVRSRRHDSQPLPPIEFFDEYAAALQAKLDQRDLGHVYRITLAAPHAEGPFQGASHLFLITRDIRAALKTPRAFHMGDRFTVDRFSWNVNRMWEPVRTTRKAA